MTVLDGGGAWYSKENKGNYPNDCFDPTLYNSDLYLIKNDETGEWADYAVIVGRANLEDGNEVFVESGERALYVCLCVCMGVHETMCV